jgi:hypothetical protein
MEKQRARTAMTILRITVNEPHLWVLSLILKYNNKDSQTLEEGQKRNRMKWNRDSLQTNPRI